MDAIEKIIQQLDEQAAAERQTLKANEQQRIEQEYQASLTEIKMDHEKRLEKSLKTLNQKYKQQANRQQVETKQAILNQKQTFLELLFEDAIEAMEQWDVEKQQTFGQQALVNLTGLDGKVLFICGEKSQAAFSKEWIAEQNKVLPFQLVVSDDLLKNQAGFVINDHGVQYNFLFRTLVQDIQSEMSYELAQEFFA
ncbi:hypothetical protein [Enterococcus sp. AZ072]|uniref:hypothetical protein n=1 Tax=unclassified Enterococcus TaxID=2608891 RepID=UPI003D29EB48